MLYRGIARPHDKYPSQCFWVEIAGEYADKVHTFMKSTTLQPRSTLKNVPCFALDAGTPFSAKEGFCIQLKIKMYTTKSVFGSLKCTTTKEPYDKYIWLYPNLATPMRVRRFLPHGTIITRPILMDPQDNSGPRFEITMFPITPVGSLPWDEPMSRTPSPESSSEERDDPRRFEIFLDPTSSQETLPLDQAR